MREFQIFLFCTNRLHLGLLDKDSKAEFFLGELNVCSPHQWHKLSLLHDGLKLLAPLRARGHLSAEQVPG